MSWNFEFSTHSLWLNFRPQVVLWRSRCRELEMWAQGLAQMSWNADLIFHSFWLNFKPQGVLWRCRCRKLEIWAQGLALMSWIFDFFFLVFLIELQTSSCFMKVSLPRAWNLTPTLGPNELKFKVLFSIMWLNFKPQAVLWRSRCRELEIYAQGLAHMSWNFE
jgi:hypothetical protein